MQDSDNNKPETSESPAPSPELSPPSSEFAAAAQLPTKELTATYEMIVGSRKAIRENANWRGEDIHPIAMLIMMLAGMESQYRSLLDRRKDEEKEALKRAREEIRKAGGQVNGSSGTSAPTTSPTVI